jgi:hypothetical protein
LKDYKQEHTLAENHEIRRVKTTVLIILFMCFCFVTDLKAQDAKPDSSVIVQLDVIGKMLKHDATQTNRWWWIWLGGYSAATVAQGAAGLASGNLHARQDLFLGATTSMIGAVGQLIWPVQPSKYPSILNRLPENNPAERLSKLNKAEEFLQIRANAETKGRSWQMHAASGAINVGSGLITWIGFDRTWQDGLINFALNSVVTEAQIWSQPIIARRSLASYRKNFPDDDKVQSNRHLYRYIVSAGSQGILVKMIF